MPNFYLREAGEGPVAPPLFAEAPVFSIESRIEGELMPPPVLSAPARVLAPPSVAAYAAAVVVFDFFPGDVDFF